MNNDYFLIRDGCPACKSVNTRELYSANYNKPPISTYLKDFYSPQGGIEFEYLNDVKFVLDECLECGCINQRLIPNDFLMTKLYEEWLDPKLVFNFHFQKHGIEYYEHLAREIEKCIKYFGGKPSELKLLDFGMGWGEWCRLAQAYGCNAFGTELSQARIDYAKTFGVQIIEWEEISEHQFDFINTEQVFEHIANPLETLQYLCKSLKTNGIIKISVPNGWDFKRRFAIMDWAATKGSENSLNIIAPLEHINCFSHDSLLRMAQIADLVPVQIQAQIQTQKRWLDLTLRDILKPIYRRMFKARYSQKYDSTYLFFQRKAV